MSKTRATDGTLALVFAVATSVFIDVVNAPSADMSSAMCDLNNTSSSRLLWWAFQSDTSCRAKSAALAAWLAASQVKVLS